MSQTPGARDDAALAAAALAGEDRAFTELMQRHKEAVYRFVRRYVGDADEAYDLVQETFLSAWASLAGFDTRRPLRAWLRRIALNKCRDWSRRRKVRRFFFTAASLDADTLQVSSSAPPDPEGREDERLQRLDAALAKLPQNLKEPLILTLFEGLSHKEVAQLLRLSPKAVETRIYRARQILATDLSDESDPS